jgi:xylitol oxidase
LQVIAMGHSLREAMYFLYIRTTKSDDLWMSLHYSSEHNGSFVALHFNWDPAKHAMIERRLLPALDKTLTPFDARPHWGKFFISREKQFLATYPKLGEFK